MTHIGCDQREMREASEFPDRAGSIGVWEVLQSRAGYRSAERLSNAAREGLTAVGASVHINSALSQWTERDISVRIEVCDAYSSLTCR
jgi:hypothetical protein